MTPEMVAGRYRVERLLARGGMGEVLEVLDVSTQKSVAVKRLLPGSSARLAGMFESEYHTLAGLRHPRIIQVYDYGVADGRPYYTMELLDGDDLRKVEPLPYRRACKYLRDIASALSLLHARRIVHRDVTPRNVRITSDDRGKLIDFGALTGFGVADVLAGTPPFMAPEAVRRAPIDHRADLFALGAVAYWLLTGANAFPAATSRELPALWRVPPLRPSDVVARDVERRRRVGEIPVALDDLVLSLLTPDPLGRPATAGEVIQRLNTIAELEPEHEVQDARSYLHGAATVGRGHEQARLESRLAHMLEGRGSGVLLDAPSGMGTTRLLSELALDAQLSGAVPLMVDAAAHRGVHGVTHAIIESLLLAMPEEAVLEARPYAAILGRFSPLLAARLEGTVDLGPLPPGELRGRTQHALSEWLLGVTRHKPLLLSVDNIHRVDEASSALLASVVREARDHALLLVMTRKTGEAATATAKASLGSIEEVSVILRLEALSRDDVHELTRSVFGDVPNTLRLAEWLHQLTAGNPRACLSLMHHLVETGALRFREGVWLLPHELPLSELPASLDQALAARFNLLGKPARRVAEILCIHRAPLPIEQCLSLLRAEGIAEPLAPLEELCGNDVLTQRDATYQFSREPARERLYESLTAERRRTLHGRLGGILFEQSATDVNARLDAGFHLLKGGKETEGADILAEAGTELVEHSDELAAAVPALQAALEVFRRERRSKYVLIRVLGPLAFAGYRVDRRLADEHGEPALELFRDLIGLRLAARMRPLLGRHLSLYLGLAAGFLRALLFWGSSALTEFHALVTAFFSCATALTGTASVCMDGERTRRYASYLEPMSALGANHAATFAYELTVALSKVQEDRMAEVVARCQRVLAHLDDTSRPIRDLTPESAALARGGALLAMGAMEAHRDGPGALRCADGLEATGLQLYAIAAAQIRSIYHGFQGDLVKAAEYERRVETLAIQAGSAWQVEIWAPCTKGTLNLVTRDALGAKANLEALDQLRVAVPSLDLYYRLALILYSSLKENPAEAYTLSRSLTQATAPRAFNGWTLAVSHEAMMLLALGQPREARALAESALQGATEDDESFVAMYDRAHEAIALADAALGDFDAACSRLERLLEKHRANAGPVTLGNLHGVRARVAILMKDRPSAELHLEAMEGWFRPTQNPALIGQCERLRRELEQPGAAGLPSLPLDGAPDLGTPEVRSALSQLAPPERASRALELLVSQTRGVGGYLFLYAQVGGDLSLAAPLHGAEPDAELRAASLRVVTEARLRDEGPTEHVASAEGDDAEARSWVRLPGSNYRVAAITAVHRGELRTVGAVAVREGKEPVLAPRTAVLEGVGQALLDIVEETRISGLPRARFLSSS